MIDKQKMYLMNAFFLKTAMLILMLFVSNQLFAESVSDIPVRYFSQHGDMCDSCSKSQTSVRYLQIVLNNDSQLNLSPKLVEDGIWGKKTKAAVVAFQFKYLSSPEANGEVRLKTKAKLDVVLARTKLEPVTEPDTPSKPVATENLTDKIRITWSSVPLANNYKIYRSTALWSKGTLLTAPRSSLSYDDISASIGRDYYYSLKACNNSLCSEYSLSVHGYRKRPISVVVPSVPSKPQASDGVYTDKVLITWSKVPDADEYQVFRSTSPSSNGNQILSSLLGNAYSLEDVTAISGVKYYYRVKACKGGLCSLLSAHDEGYRKSTSVGASIWINPQSDVPNFSAKQKQMYQAYLYGVSPILLMESTIGIKEMRNSNMQEYEGFEAITSFTKKVLDSTVAGISIGESKTSKSYLFNLAKETVLMSIDSELLELGDYVGSAILDRIECGKGNIVSCATGTLDVVGGAGINVANVYNATDYWWEYGNITKKQQSYMIANAYINLSIKNGYFKTSSNSLIEQIADKIGIDTGWNRFTRDYDEAFAKRLFSRYRNAIEKSYLNFPSEYPIRKTINHKPDKPNLQINGGSNSGVSLTPVLRAFDWSDPDQGDTHEETWWGIRDYSSGRYIYESDWSSSNKYLISISSSVGLQKGKKYQAVVAFMDNHGTYSIARFVTFTTKADTNPNNKPNTPSMEVNGGVNDVSLTPVLTTSSFSDLDANDSHDATWWEIRKTGNVIWNSSWDETNLTSITIPSGILDLETTYTVYVRHRDSRSAISGLGSVTFTTKSAIGTDNKPDLAVINVSVSNTSPIVGESIQLEADIKNIGSATATSTHTRYYVSTDSNISTSDTEVDSETTPSLDAGETDFERETFSAPATSGTYWVGMCVDVVSNESDTSNNCSSGLKVVVSESSNSNSPDLIILNPSISNFSLNPSESFTFNYSVKNIGDGGSNVSDTRIRFYKSTDSIVDTSDIDIGTNAADSLTPNQVKSFTRTLQAPSNAGTYWIGACVSLTSSESNINNNCSSGVKIDVKEQTLEQDVFSENSVLLPSFAEKGQEVHVLVNQYYKGSSPSKQDPSIVFYWSKNSSLNTSEDVFLGRAKCDLAPQDFLNHYDRYCQVKKSVNLPTAISEGKQYLLIVTDFNNDLNEVNEDNNVEARPLTIKSDVVSDVGDFYVSNSRLRTDKVLPDGYTRIYTDHSYIGTSATRQKVYVGYYLSSDTQLDSSDVLLGDDYSYLQASNLSDPEDARLTIPAEILPGDYHILVVSDYGEQFVEVNKANNIESVPLTVISSDTEDLYLKDVKVQKTSFLVGEAIKPDSYLFYNGSSKSKLAIDVGYYLSKDRIFDSSDIKLGTRANTFSKYDYVEHETASSGVVNGELKTYNIPDDALAGAYYILFVIDDNDAHVETNEGNNVESFTIHVTNNSTPIFSLDIDGDGEVKPLTDGLLNLRYQFGFRGDTLINGAVDVSATRKTANEIETYLIEGGLSLDIDGDGEIKPLTDGLLTLRYLFGFRGDTLINGAVGGNATRKTSQAVESQIQVLIP